MDPSGAPAVLIRLGGGANPVWSAVVGRGFCWEGNGPRDVEKADAVDNVGEDVDERGEVRCMGLRPTGGGTFFVVELVVDIDRRRSSADAGREAVDVLFIEVWARFLDKAETAVPAVLKLEGAGKVRVPLVELKFEFRGFGGGGATALAACC